MRKDENSSRATVGSNRDVEINRVGESVYWGGRSDGNEGTERLLCCVIVMTGCKEGI